MKKSLSEQIARFIFNSSFEALAENIRLISRLHLLDTIGCCLAATKLETSAYLANYLLSEKGSEQATAIGLPVQLPAAQAAFMNGLLARSLEFDDMAMPDLHPSGVIIPVVLALSELNQLSGKVLIEAITIGIELCLRLGRAGVDLETKTSLFLQRGQDSTAICGAIAGAAIGAKLLGLNEQGIVNAIGIAISFASGSLEANRSGGNIKQFQSGWAAKSAIQAALLAKFKISGPEQALEGRYGFYQCFLDGKFSPAILTENLGTKWEMTNLRYKPYPTNYYTHAGIDAALSLLKQGLEVDGIESIHLAVAKPMLRTVGEPIDRKRKPLNAYEAKFSAPYTLAATLLGGTGLGLGIDDFKEKLINDPLKQALMQKIIVTSDERCDAIFPDHAPAILTVIDHQGKKWVEEAWVNRGSSENPLSEQEINLKFTDNVSKVLAPQVMELLQKNINNIENEKNLNPLTEIFRLIVNVDYSK